MFSRVSSLLLLLVLIFSSFTAHAANTDCNGILDFRQFLICNNDDLSKLDRQADALLSEIISKTPQKDLRKQFSKNMVKSCPKENDPECLRSFYKTALVKLKSIAEEANSNVVKNQKENEQPAKAEKEEKKEPSFFKKSLPDIYQAYLKIIFILLPAMMWFLLGLIIRQIPKAHDFVLQACDKVRGSTENFIPSQPYISCFGLIFVIAASWWIVSSFISEATYLALNITTSSFKESGSVLQGLSLHAAALGTLFYTSLKMVFLFGFVSLFTVVPVWIGGLVAALFSFSFFSVPALLAYCAIADIYRHKKEDILIWAKKWWIHKSVVFRCLMICAGIWIAIFVLSAIGMFISETDLNINNRFVQHVIALAAGVFLGAMCSDKFKEFRRFLLLAALALGALYVSFTNVFVANVIIFVVAFAVVYTWLKIPEIKKKRQRKPQLAFGSAEWASYEHLMKNNLIGTDGIRLGQFEWDGQFHNLHYTGDRHLMTVAPTRSGKGTAAIIPNLLTYQGSVLVIDPKGENARITAEHRGNRLNQEVHVLDPWGITGINASKFNPLDWLNKDDPDISENAMMLADAIVTPRGGNTDPFWDEEAKALLYGLLLYVAIDEREEGNRTLARMRDIVVSRPDDFNSILDVMEKSDNHIIRTTSERFEGKTDKQASSIISTLQSHTHFLDSPRIRTSLSASDFCFEDLKAKNISVYLVLPADRLETFKRWLRLLIQQALTVNARNIEIKPKKPILFILDEMASLGNLTMLEQAYSLMAGFGMQLWGIVQDVSQLEKIYEKGWETFVGNSGVLQYFGSRDFKTADYFSKLCGVTTVEKFSITNAIAKAVSWATSTAWSSGNSSHSSQKSYSVSNSESTTYDVVQRHLAYPDELMVLKNEAELVLVGNCNPIHGKKTPWFEDQKLKGLGKNIHST